MPRFRLERLCKSKREESKSLKWHFIRARARPSVCNVNGTKVLHKVTITRKSHDFRGV